MQKAYCIVYQANRKPNTTTHAIHNSVPVKKYYSDNGVELPDYLDDLKIDMGDDPSIIAYAAGLGFLTWGTCRPDKRNDLEPDDYVVFFAREINNSVHQYFLTGYAKVADRMTQVGFLTNGKMENYSSFPEKYANLLIQEKNNNEFKWSEWPGEINGKIYESIIGELALKNLLKQPRGNASTGDKNSLIEKINAGITIISNPTNKEFIIILKNDNKINSIVEKFKTEDSLTDNFDNLKEIKKEFNRIRNKDTSSENKQVKTILELKNLIDDNLNNYKNDMKINKDIDKNYRNNCWHPDWVKRICDKEININNQSNIELAKNYIIFNQVNILKEPIRLVNNVTFPSKSKPEFKISWNSASKIQQLIKLTYAEHDIVNKNYKHTPRLIVDSVVDCMNKLEKICIEIRGQNPFISPPEIKNENS